MAPVRGPGRSFPLYRLNVCIYITGETLVKPADGVSAR